MKTPFKNENLGGLINELTDDVYGVLHDRSQNPYVQFNKKENDHYDFLKSDGNYLTDKLLNVFKSACGLSESQLTSVEPPKDLVAKKLVFLTEFAKCKDLNLRILFYKKLESNNLLEYAKDCSFYKELESLALKEKLALELSDDLPKKSTTTKKVKI